MNRHTLMILAGVLLAGAAAFYLWERQGGQPAEPVPAASKLEPLGPGSLERAGDPDDPTSLESLPAEVPPQAPLPPLARSDESVRPALMDWLGKDKVASFLQLDDFVRHTVWPGWRPLPPLNT